MSVDVKFEKACADAKGMTKASDPEKGKVYGLYKQAMFGDCNIPKPDASDKMASAKWAAWNDRKGMSQEKAKEEYCTLMQSLVAKHGLGG